MSLIFAHVLEQILAKAMDVVEYEAGEKVITEGEDGDAFYIIESGNVQVTKIIEGVDKKLVVLKERQVRSPPLVSRDAHECAHCSLVFWLIVRSVFWARSISGSSRC